MSKAQIERVIWILASAIMLLLAWRSSEIETRVLALEKAHVEAGK